MTAVVVAPLPVPPPPPSSSVDIAFNDPSAAEARKRRRELLDIQRSLGGEPIPTSTHATASAMDEDRALKFRRVSSDESSVDSSSSYSTPVTNASSASRAASKKTQIKYEPDVPMSKEEATAWRREQRRKRNRESAAASRQRQRVRINELEKEVEEWKKKYEDIMAQVRLLEESVKYEKSPNPLEEHVEMNLQAVDETATTIEESVSKEISHVSPGSSSVDAGEDQGAIEAVTSGEEINLEPVNMISRPAVSRIILL